MYRFVLVAVVAAAAACVQTDNNRPAELEYITEAILQPSCSQYTCHSSYRMQSGYAFDTVEMARRSLGPLVVKGDAAGSRLYGVLTRTIARMPYDAPLPQKDIDLIETWINEGAAGLSVTP